MAIRVGTSDTKIKKVAIVGSNTLVKKVTIGTPVRRVTAGANSITNIGGINLSGVTDGSILVYNSANQEFQSKINIDNPNTNFDGGNF